jgi:hypothetical protein
MSPLTLFFKILHNLEQKHTHLAQGSLLSAPAIEYKGRAFAVCCNDQVLVKLHDPDVFNDRGIRAVSEYRPFNTGIVLGAWRQVPFYYHSDWAELIELALASIRDEIDIPIANTMLEAS